MYRKYNLNRCDILKYGKGGVRICVFCETLTGHFCLSVGLCGFAAASCTHIRCYGSVGPP